MARTNKNWKTEAKEREKNKKKEQEQENDTGLIPASTYARKTDQRGPASSARMKNAPSHMGEMIQIQRQAIKDTGYELKKTGTIGELPAVLEPHREKLQQMNDAGELEPLSIYPWVQNDIEVDLKSIKDERQLGHFSMTLPESQRTKLAYAYADYNKKSRQDVLYAAERAMGGKMFSSPQSYMMQLSGLYDMNGNPIDINTASPYMVEQGINGIADEDEIKKATKAFIQSCKTPGSRFYGHAPSENLGTFRESASLTTSQYNKYDDEFKTLFWQDSGHEAENDEAYYAALDMIERDDSLDALSKINVRRLLDGVKVSVTGRPAGERQTKAWGEAPVAVKDKNGSITLYRPGDDMAKLNGLKDRDGNILDLATAKPEDVDFAIRNDEDDTRRKKRAESFIRICQTPGSPYEGYTPSDDLMTFRNNAGLTTTDIKNRKSEYQELFYVGSGYEERNAEKLYDTLDSIEDNDNLDQLSKITLTEMLYTAYMDVTGAKSLPERPQPKQEALADDVPEKAQNQAQEKQEDGGFLKTILENWNALLNAYRSDDAEVDAVTAATYRTKTGMLSEAEKQDTENEAEKQTEEAEQTPVLEQTQEETTPEETTTEEPEEMPEETATEETEQAEQPIVQEEQPVVQAEQPVEQAEQEVYGPNLPEDRETRDAADVEDMSDAFDLLMAGYGYKLGKADQDYLFELYKSSGVQVLWGMMDNELFNQVGLGLMGEEQLKRNNLYKLGSTLFTAAMDVNSRSFPDELKNTSMLILSEIARNAEQAVSRGEFVPEAWSNIYEDYLKLHPEEKARIDEIYKGWNQLEEDKARLRAESEERSRKSLQDAIDAVANGNPSDEQYNMVLENAEVSADDINRTMTEYPLGRQFEYIDSPYFAPGGGFESGAIRTRLDADGVLDDLDFRMALKDSMNAVYYEDARMAAMLDMSLAQYYKRMGGMTVDQLASRANVRMQEQAAAITQEEKDALDAPYGDGVGALEVLGRGADRGFTSWQLGLADSLYIGKNALNVRRTAAHMQAYYQNNFGIFGRDFFRRDLQALIDSGNLDPSYSGALQKALDSAADIYDIGIDPRERGGNLSDAGDLRRSIAANDAFMKQNGTEAENFWYGFTANTVSNLAMYGTSAAASTVLGPAAGFTIGYGLPVYSERVYVRLNEGYSLESANALGAWDTAAMVVANVPTFGGQFGQMTGASSLSKAGALMAARDNPSAMVRLAAAAKQFGKTLAANVADEAIKDPIKEGMGQRFIDSWLAPMYKKVDAGEDPTAADVLIGLARALSPKRMAENAAGTLMDTVQGAPMEAVMSVPLALVGAGAETFHSVRLANDLVSGKTSGAEAIGEVMDAVDDDSIDPSFWDAIHDAAVARLNAEKTVQELITGEASRIVVTAVEERAKETQYTEKAAAAGEASEQAKNRYQDARERAFEGDTDADVDMENALDQWGKAETAKQEAAGAAEKAGRKAEEAEMQAMQTARSAASMRVASEMQARREAIKADVQARAQRLRDDAAQWIDYAEELNRQAQEAFAQGADMDTLERMTGDSGNAYIEYENLTEQANAMLAGEQEQDEAGADAAVEAQDGAETAKADGETEPAYRPVDGEQQASVSADGELAQPYISESVSRGNLDPVTQRLASVMKKHTGLEMIVMPLADNIRGLYDRANKRMILSTRLGSGEMMRQVVMHELTHFTESTKGYAAYEDAVLEAAYRGNEDALERDAQEIRTMYEESGVAIGTGDVHKELVAAATEKLVDALGAWGKTGSEQIIYDLIGERLGVIPRLYLKLSQFLARRKAKKNGQYALEGYNALVTARDNLKAAIREAGKAGSTDAAGQDVTIELDSAKRGRGQMQTENEQTEMQYSLVGRTDDGKGIYESNYAPDTPRSVKVGRFIDLWQNVWSKSPIDLEVIGEDGNSRKITASFDPDFDPENQRMTDLGKVIHSKNGSAGDRTITLNLADDLHDMARDAKYVESESERGKLSLTHADVKEWHYFSNDFVYRDGNGDKPMTLWLDLKERNNGGWVYQLYAKKTKKKDGATDPRTVAGGRSITTPSSDTSIQQNKTGVNPNSTQNGPQYALAPRQFNNENAQRTDALTDEVKELLLGEGSEYETIVNRELVENANRDIDARGAEGMADELVDKRVWDPKDTARAMVALVRASRDGDLTTAAMIGMEIGRRGTALGQNLQLYRILKAMTPEGAIGSMVRKAAKENRKNGVSDGDIPVGNAPPMKTRKGGETDKNGFTADRMPEKLQNAYNKAGTVYNALNSLPQDIRYDNPWKLPLNPAQMALIQEYGLKGTKLPGDNYHAASLKQRMLAAIIATPNNVRGDGLMTLCQQLEAMKAGYAVVTEADLNYINGQASTLLYAEGEFSGMPKTTEGKIALQRMYDAQSNTVQASLGEKANALGFNNMLSSPKTWSKNIASNMMIRPLELVSEKVGGTIEKAIVTPKTGNRTTDAPNRAERKAGKAAFTREIGQTMVDYFITHVDTGHGSKFDLRRGGRTFNSEVLNAYKTLVDFAMQIGDRPFWEQCYAEELAVVQRLGMKIRTEDEQGRIGMRDMTMEEMENEAAVRATERVFQEDNQIVAGISAMRQKSPILDLALTTFMPFLKTPTNVGSRMMQYSPVGLLRTLIQYGLWDGKTNGGRNFDQRKFVMNLGRGLTGTGLAAVGFFLAGSGMIQPGYQDEKDKDRRAMRKANGESYSTYIKLGDMEIPLDFAQPACGPLYIGAKVAWELAQREDMSFGDAVGTALCASFAETGDQLFNNTFLSGISDLFRGYKDANGIITSGIESFIENQMSRATPASIRALAKMTDPYVRDTASQDAVHQIINEQIVQNWPILRQTLPVKNDVTGQPALQNGYWNWGKDHQNKALHMMNAFAFPFSAIGEKHDEALDTLLDLSYRTGEAGFLPGEMLASNAYELKVSNTLAESLKLGKEAVAVPLTDEEKRDINRAYGTLLFDGDGGRKYKDVKGYTHSYPGLRDVMQDKATYTCIGKTRPEKKWSKMNDDERMELVTKMAADAKTMITIDAAKKKRKAGEI